MKGSSDIYVTNGVIQETRKEILFAAAKMTVFIMYSQKE